MDLKDKILASRGKASDDDIIQMMQAQPEYADKVKQSLAAGHTPKDEPR